MLHRKPHPEKAGIEHIYRALPERYPPRKGPCVSRQGSGWLPSLRQMVGAGGRASLKGSSACNRTRASARTMRSHKTLLREVARVGRDARAGSGVRIAAPQRLPAQERVTRGSLQALRRSAWPEPAMRRAHARRACAKECLQPKEREGG